MISVSGELRVDKLFTLTCTATDGSMAPVIRWNKIAGNLNVTSNPRIQGVC